MINVRYNRRISKSLVLGILFLTICFSLSPAVSVAADSEYETVTTLAEVGQRVLQSVYDRESVVQIRYRGDTENLTRALEQMLEEILASDDYLRYSIYRWGYGYRGYAGDVVLTFSFQYWTTLGQENYVDKRIKEILSEIIKPGMSTDERQKAIHDYIVTNVAYDQSFSRYSAYDALAEGKTVCQGYALLAYKMLKEAGIENLIISGTAGGQNHAWNLVRIRGNWYHMDVTWDDPLPDVAGRVTYRYYNLTDEQMRMDHSWDSSLYPSSSKVKYTYESSYSAEYQNYKELPTLGEIPANKEFTVTFSKGVDINSARAQIVLLDIATGDEIPCEIYLGRESSIIKIKPTVLLTKGREYILVIQEGIKAEDGTGLKQGAVCRAFVD